MVQRVFLLNSEQLSLQASSQNGNSNKVVRLRSLINCVRRHGGKARPPTETLG